MTHQNRWGRCGVVLAVSCLWMSTAYAQEPTGMVRGRVTTTTGAPLGGVRVVAQAPQLTLDCTGMSGADGMYTLALLPPGDYVITFSRDDFVTVKHVTRVSALETISVDTALAAAADHDELIRVSIDTARFPRPPARLDLVRQSRLDWLPLEHSLFGVMARAPGLVGMRMSDAAVAFDGAPIHFFATHDDRPVINPGPSAMADATIVLSAVPADITHLRSGAISIVPQRGGDRLGGVITATVSSAGRSADSVHDARDTRGMGGGFDLGAGVPLAGRRSWVYGAASRSIERLQPRAHLSETVFEERADDRFWDLHANHALTPRHRLRGTALRGARVLDDARPLGAGSVEEASAADARRHTHGLMSASYDGQFGDTSFVTARVTGERWRAETRGRTAGLPAVWDRQTGGFAGAAGACAGCELDDRTNLSWTAAVRRPASLAGDLHVVTVGAVQGFGDIDTPAAAPAGSVDLLASRFVAENGQVFPVLEPNGSSWIVLRTGESARLSHGSQGVFISDEWRRGPALTIRAGLRWDRQRLSLDGTSNPDLVRSGLSPRLHVAWQPDPDGWGISGGFARYEADLLHLAGERLAPWGDWFAYDGGPVNIEAGSPRVDALTATRLATLTGPRFAGADATWHALVSRSASALSPTAEWSVGTGGHVMSGLQLRADVIAQRSRPLDLDQNPALAGAQDFTALSFERPASIDLGLLTRRYTALVLLATYDLGIQASIGGRYTLSRLSGDLDDRAAQSPVASWASPSGDLSGDRRHRMSVWGQVTPIDSEDRGTVGIIAMYTRESGSPFGAVGWIDAAPSLAGPPGAPVLMPYYFTARDGFRTEGLSRTDIGLRYARRLPGTVRTDLVLQFHVLNALNGREVVDEASFAAARSSFTHPSQFATFNPFAEQPAAGVHWDLDPRLAGALPSAERTMPRAYRIVAGIRF